MGAVEAPRTFYLAVQTDSETGRKEWQVSTPVNPLPRSEDLTRAQGFLPLNFFDQRSVQPDNVYRHHWQICDAAIRDNRSTTDCLAHGYDSRDNHSASIKRSFRLRLLRPTLAWPTIEGS